MPPGVPKQQHPDPVTACLLQLFQQPSSAVQLSVHTPLVAEAKSQLPLEFCVKLQQESHA